MRYGFSERYYDAMRRRRGWSMNSPQGLQGYSAFLAGDPGVPEELGAVVGAEAAAFEAEPGIGRAVLIGVATGALTFLVNRWLGKVLK